MFSMFLLQLPEMSGMSTPMSNATPGGHGFQGQMTTPGRMGQGFGGDTGGPNIGLTGLSNQVHSYFIDRQLMLHVRVQSSFKCERSAKIKYIFNFIFSNLHSVLSSMTLFFQWHGDRKNQ